MLSVSSAHDTRPVDALLDIYGLTDDRTIQDIAAVGGQVDVTQILGLSLRGAIEKGADPDSTYYTSAPFTCTTGPWWHCVPFRSA